MFVHKVIMTRPAQDILFENEVTEFIDILTQLKDLRTQSSGFISDEETLSDDKLIYTKWNNWQTKDDWINYCKINEEITAQYTRMRIAYNEQNNITTTIEDSEV